MNTTVSLFKSGVLCTSCPTTVFCKHWDQCSLSASWY